MAKVRVADHSTRDVSSLCNGRRMDQLPNYGKDRMTNKDFGVIAVFAMLFTMGTILMTRPRLIPRFTNAYYALIGMKSRLAEEDYDKKGIRVAGAAFLLFAIYILISHFTHSL